MASVLDRLLALWLAPGGDAAAFAGVYADPVVVNGIPLHTAELVGRSRALNAA